MNTAAFFDLDGTIVEGTSGLRFARFLFRRRILPLKTSLIIPSLKIFYDLVKGEVNKYMDEVDDMLGTSMKGVKKSLVQEQAKQYAGLEKHYMRANIVKVINNHKKNGVKLFMLSASPDELVKEVGKMLGFDESIGTRIETRGGIYTGRVLKPSLIGKDRVEIVKKLAKKYNINLNQSFAYGNCVNDVPVLETVGNPVAVNPNKYLKPIAVKNNWTIMN